MAMSLTVSGDWDRLNRTLQNLSQMGAMFKGQITEDGDFVLEKLKGHIASQDLGWTPLSPHTVALKGGDTTIYVETGALMGGMQAKRISWGGADVAVLIGIEPGAGHPSGYSMADIMGWMEYGTSKQPPRPLIRPTYEEVKGILMDNWKQLFVDFIHKSVG